MIAAPQSRGEAEASETRPAPLRGGGVVDGGTADRYRLSVPAGAHFVPGRGLLGRAAD